MSPELETMQASFQHQSSEIRKELTQYLSEDGFLPDGAPQSIQDKYNRWIALEDVVEAFDNLGALIDAVPQVSE